MMNNKDGMLKYTEERKLDKFDRIGRKEKNIKLFRISDLCIIEKDIFVLIIHMSM